MKRILQIVNGMNRGGTETFIMNMYRSIDREQIQFDFLVHVDVKCAYDDEIISMGGIIYRIPPRRQGVQENRKALTCFFREHPEYTTVHQHVSSLSYIEPLKTAMRFGIPVRIVHSHNTFQSGNKLHKYFHLWNQKSVGKYATEYLACSETAALWFYGHQRYDNNQYTVIKNGIDVKSFMFTPKGRDKIRCEFGIENKYVIGHIGRFAKAKNHSYLLDIFDAIRKISSNTVLMLTGDGELKQAVQAKAKVLGLEDHIIFTGIRADTSDIYSAMDIFLFPSLFEGLPVTLVEAQASGLPCIISNGITSEVKLRDDCISVSLESSAKQWAEICIDLLGEKRAVGDPQSSVAAYDIKKVSAVLQEIYL